jgi:U32 family peptidase
LDINPWLPQLLCPAGDLEKLRTALAYGADAVYLGGTRLNLRSKAAGFSENELQKALKLAGKHGARVYYCLNALPLQKDIPEIEKQLEMVSGLGVDALIVADPGVVSLVQKKAPDMEIHLSTQANTCNSLSVNFWKEQGVKRVNLSRELSMKDIRAISTQSGGMELEVFVHGAMCMAISGRCFLSAHLNERSANQGLCAHPCRYEYKPILVDFEERTRPGYPVWSLEQEQGYSRIFSADDLCLVKYIPWFIRNRIHCLKIEGRTKSVSYLAIVTDVYRTALLDLAANKFHPARYLEELSLISTRLMGSGFFLNKRIFFADKRTAPDRSRKILARVLEKAGNNKWLIQVKEKWPCTQDIELVLPGLNRPGISSRDYCLENEHGQGVPEANSGMNALFCCAHEAIRENIFIRSSS